MSGKYTERRLVQKMAVEVLSDELQWKTVYVDNNEKFDGSGTLGRTNKRDVLLIRHLCAALKKLNPWIDSDQIKEVCDALKNVPYSSSPLEINEKNYYLIRDGVNVTVNKPNGETERKTAMLIDFQNPENNSFLAAEEFPVEGDIYNRRADLVGFVNGIPLIFFEFKNHTVNVKTAYDDNYSDYQSSIPQLFRCNAFVVLSNGVEAKVGTLGSKYEFFHEWKRLKEGDEGHVDLATMLRGICRKENFLDLFENFILYDKSGGKTAKILARNHQYLGVNEAVKVYEEKKLKDKKLGVFWHTQGSGKSYSMAFFAQKIRRKCGGSPTFVVLTDRDGLNKQISGTFEACGLLGNARASHFIAKSARDLEKKLRSGSVGFVFTLIQKFNNPKAEPIHAAHDIIVMSDEAHRSQYGKFADNMMHLLPDASRIGFTGTPIFKYDNITERTFGDYVSIYDFRMAVDDGATVPLYYENRAVKIADLKNPKITEEICNAIDEEDADEEQRAKLEAKFEEEIHILKAEPRLRAIAKDFAHHYSSLWQSGKAMFVCLDRVTCVLMYNYVREYWKEETKAAEKTLKYATQQEAQELEQKIRWMKETEMAVVISDEQNETETFKKWGLDITPHRRKMKNRELDKEFKDEDNPFRIVFVCAMWMTGFDVKCLSCLYIDKPLKAHTLMQTIARANRVNEGKSNGLIVDYIGIVKAMRSALADYTAKAASDGGDPTIDKEELISHIEELTLSIEKGLSDLGFELMLIVNANDRWRLEYVQDGMNAVCVSEETRKEYIKAAGELCRLMKYAARDEIKQDIFQRYRAIKEIKDGFAKKRSKTDTTELEVRVTEIISKEICILPETRVAEGSSLFDLSKIDFIRLKNEFAKIKHKNLLLKDLKDEIEMSICQMLDANSSEIRRDFYKRYCEIIEAYNKEQDRAEIEKTFHDLMVLVGNLSEEQKRYVREGFADEEELAIYDLLFREGLTKEEIQKIKGAAKLLKEKITEEIGKLSGFTQNSQPQAQVEEMIYHILWEELPTCYENNSVSGYTKNIYSYIYARYTAKGTASYAR